MSNVREARLFWSEKAKRAVTVCFVVSLLPLAALGVACGVSAKNAAVKHRRTLVVLPFDLHNYSLDRRPETIAPLRHWTAELAGQIAADLHRNSSFRVLGSAEALSELRKVRADYRDPTECPTCMISIGTRAGADILVIGQVRKLSNLITFFHVQVYDVRTRRVLRVIAIRADGADTDAMWRRIARRLADDVARIAAHGR